ncbi:transposase, partial [mine drainage metagenome]
GQICGVVKPNRTDRHGKSWESLLALEDEIKDWVDEGLTVIKIGTLLSRRSIVVSPRTLARFASERCGASKKKTTVRVDDPPPGKELQVDFGKLGLIDDDNRKRGCHGLIFTACYSRH